jgi:hypothetical protein
MTFREDISKASNATVSSARWIHTFNFLIATGSVIGIPFTMGVSLFGLLSIPFNSALASIANNSCRQTELTKLHLKMLADLHNLN